MATRLLEQFRGHPAEPHLLDRQKLVNVFMDLYPDYFPSLEKRCQELGLLDEDGCQQILYGNTGCVLKLEETFRNRAQSTPVAQRYFSCLGHIEALQKGIKTLESQINSFMEKAVSLTGSPEIDLATFEWNKEQLSTFNKRELRSYDPKTITRLRDEVIPSKKGNIRVTQLETDRFLKDYQETTEYLDLLWYRNYLTLYPECKELYQATRLANEMLAKGGHSDGGFELDVLGNPAVLRQWIGQLGLLAEYPDLNGLVYVEKYGGDFYVKRYLDNRPQTTNGGNGNGKCLSHYLAKRESPETPLLIFYPGLYYVMRYERGKKVYYKSAETDLIIYDAQKRQVVARGEVKANYNDVPHADYQHRRNWLMLTGELEDGTDTEAFAEYLDLDPTTTTTPTPTRYLAEKGEYEKPLFYREDFCDQESLRHFIITKPQASGGQLEVSSKVATQIAHWLFSSAKTPPDYIDSKIAALLEGLHFRDWETIRAGREVFVVH